MAELPITQPYARISAPQPGTGWRRVLVFVPGVPTSLRGPWSTPADARRQLKIVKELLRAAERGARETADA